MVNDNEMDGYTLQPGPEPELFQEMGLQPGDVVVQVNDVRLDSKESGTQALRSIQAGDDASLTIVRDGQEQVMSFRMPE
jgi:general secretion pathway protein C